VIAMSKQRIIDLQKQVKIARDALGKIVNGHAGGRDPYTIADQALDDMRRHDPAPSSAGLLGWEKRS
jgi:hypothetical protein